MFNVPSFFGFKAGGEPPVPPLLDLYPGAAAAYSLRLLNTAYTGAAIRVRVDIPGDPEFDIGFTSSGRLDTATLLSVVGANDAYLDTWYDQSGSIPAKDATQVTAAFQPQIVSSGSVITENGKPSVQFNGAQNMSASGSIFIGGAYSAFVAVTPSNISQDSSFFQIGLSGSDGLAAGFGGLGTAAVIGSRLRAGGVFVGASEILSNTDMILYSGIGIVSTLTNDGYLNNASMTGVVQCRSTISPSSQLVIGSSGNNSSQFLGKLSDVIFYGSDESANVNGINTNINDFYSIYP